jgi:hypothetical protein
VEFFFFLSLDAALKGRSSTEALAFAAESLAREQQVPHRRLRAGSE